MGEGRPIKTKEEQMSTTTYLRQLPGKTKEEQMSTTTYLRQLPGWAGAYVESNGDTSGWLVSNDSFDELGAWGAEVADRIVFQLDWLMAKNPEYVEALEVIDRYRTSLELTNRMVESTASMLGSASAWDSFGSGAQTSDVSGELSEVGAKKWCGEVIPWAIRVFNKGRKGA